MVSYAVTGASRGLGLEFIRQLSRDESNTVFALVRNKTSSPELIELSSKPHVHIVQGDITSLSQLQEAAKTISTITGGSLDVLINNAADLAVSTVMIQPSQLSDAENLEHVKASFATAVETNVLGAIYVTNTFLPLIERGRAKKIVHASTGMADTELTLGTEISNLVPYSASKAMMNNIVAKYGAELRPKNIHIVAMSPGWVNTNAAPQQVLDWMRDMFRKVDPGVNERIEPEESVHAQLQTISNLTWDVQGRMISHHGDRNWF